MTKKRDNNQEDTIPETEIWLPLKEASKQAACCDATIKRAITSKKLVGRKTGTGHNASYEISETSFKKWLIAKGKPKSEVVEHAEPTTASTNEPPAEPPADLNEAEVKPKMSKAERRKLKAANKKEIPESVRHLRRWKNFMRHANQEQALAMIKWLSARLDPKKSLQKKILKGARQSEGTQTLSPS